MRKINGQLQHPDVDLDWATLKHGTLTDFVRARSGSIESGNLEQLSAALKEYARMVEQLVMDPDNGFRPDSRRLLPCLTKFTWSGINKYLRSLQIWTDDYLSPSERETFIATVFVWK